jgi:hypothetical protein
LPAAERASLRARPACPVRTGRADGRTNTRTAGADRNSGRYRTRARPDQPARFVAGAAMAAGLPSTPSMLSLVSARGLPTGGARLRHGPGGPDRPIRPGIRAGLDVRDHLVPAPRTSRHEGLRARVVDADPLVEKLITTQAERGDPAPSLRPDRQLPRASKQPHSLGS